MSLSPIFSPVWLAKYWPHGGDRWHSWQCFATTLFLIGAIISFAPIKTFATHVIEPAKRNNIPVRRVELVAIDEGTPSVQIQSSAFDVGKRVTTYRTVGSDFRRMMLVGRYISSGRSIPTALDCSFGAIQAWFKLRGCSKLKTYTASLSRVCERDINRQISWFECSRQLNIVNKHVWTLTDSKEFLGVARLPLRVFISLLKQYGLVVSFVGITTDFYEGHRQDNQCCNGDYQVPKCYPEMPAILLFIASCAGMPSVCGIYTFPLNPPIVTATCLGEL